MTIIIRCLILLLSLSSSAFATVGVMRFPSGTPTQVCQPNDTNPACLAGSGGVTNLTPNVGIGSASPGQQLDVKGTVRALYFVGNGSLLTNLPSTPQYWVTGNVGINTTNNVGIGSVNPGAALDVNGTVRATGFSGPGIVPSGSANQVAYWGSAGQTLSGSSNFNFNGTNVGIGTVIPTTSLSVLGNVSIGTLATVSDWLTVNGGATSNSGITINDGGIATGGNDGNTVFLGHDSSSAMTDVSASAFTVTNNNSVTFANTTPAFSGTYYAVFAGTTSLSTANQSAFNTTTITLDMWIYPTAMPTSGNEAMLMSYRSTGFSGGWEWALYNESGTVYDDFSSSSSNFQVAESPALNTWTHLAVVDNAGTATLYVNGVSLGSGSPGTLTANSNRGMFIGNWYNSNQPFTGSIQEPRISNIARWSSNFTPPTVPYGALSTSTPTLTFGNNSSALAQIKMNSANSVLSVTGSGMNVGIGTTLASGGLVVMNGNVGIGTWVPITPFQVNGTSQNVNIASNGNLGIGTFLPVAFLDVEQTSANALTLLRLANTSGLGATNLDFGNTISTVTIQTRISSVRTNAVSNGDADLAFNTLGGGTLTEKMRVTSGGNLGIGTTTPQGQFIVYSGNVGIGTSTPQGAFTVTNGNVGIGTWTAAGGNLIIKGGGNVGIGTAWPGVALDVNGTIRSGANCLYRCVGGVDAGVIQTSACNLCPAGSCTALNGCF